MANEAVCIEAPRIIVRRTVADAAGIAKGTILKLTSPNTVEASSANNDIFGGIAIEEKTANDGITQIGVALDGVWAVKLKDEAVATGKILKISGANEIGLALNADAEEGRFCAKAEEDGQNQVKRARFIGY